MHNDISICPCAVCITGCCTLLLDACLLCENANMDSVCEFGVGYMVGPCIVGCIQFGGSDSV